MASDARLSDGLRAYLSWRVMVENHGTIVGFDQVRILRELASDLQRAARLAAAALQQGINRANARCITTLSLAEANAALRWQAIADSLGIAG